MIEEGIARMAKGRATGEQPMLGEATPPSTLENENLILEDNKAITKKIDDVANTVALLRHDMGKMRERVKDLSTRAGGAEEILGAHTGQLVDQERFAQRSLPVFSFFFLLRALQGFVSYADLRSGAGVCATAVAGRVREGLLSRTCAPDFPCPESRRRCCWGSHVHWCSGAPLTVVRA
ncbi:hypothetical protein NDU88_000749 [Pleurodeles waltl]|uniref:V-SNARE coiled-coil homology domain-containing protein n=1 Tax=Pleurodeles waltl TaxID=8319 RepID=A0AAV7MMX5_PLEWA|nr:hypothetical protein NDU88_000749 [Pleurodeles waltl]